MGSKSITSQASKRNARESSRQHGGYIAASRNGTRQNGMVYVRTKPSRQAKPKES